MSGKNTKKGFYKSKKKNTRKTQKIQLNLNKIIFKLVTKKHRVKTIGRKEK